jgi:hypothetical protein
MSGIYGLLSFGSRQDIYWLIEAHENHMGRMDVMCPAATERKLGAGPDLIVIAVTLDYATTREKSAQFISPPSTLLRPAPTRVYNFV